MALLREGQWPQVNAWPGSFRGPALDGDVSRLWICAQAEIRPNGRYFYRLLDARILARVGAAENDVPDPWDCRDLELQLWSEGALTLAPLRSFCDAVARTDTLIGPFSDRTASRWHHHGYRGGLFDHSLDVAEMIGKLPFDPVQKELGQVAGLFHDLGKIRTLDRNGAQALRHLWAYPRIRPETSPLRTLLEAVRQADHLSAGLAAEKLAFAGQPPECREGVLPSGGARNRNGRPSFGSALKT